MANHCYNEITITGKKEELLSFYNETLFYNEGTLKYEDLLKCYYPTNDRKKNASWFDMEIEHSEDEIKIYGDSSWCPSLNLFEKISIKYVSLNIEYFYEEMGCDFIGKAIISNGTTEDECYAYWEGKVIFDEEYAFECAINDELSCYESEEDLIESSMFLAFSKEKQTELLTKYK